MKAAIVFDLDGTLVDSVADIAGAVNRMLADIDQEPLSQDTIQRFVGNGLPKLVERVIRHCNLPSDQHGDLTKLTLRHYNAASCNETVPYPGVIQSLKTLREMGCALGVCTNKPEEPARHVLQVLELEPYFEAVFGGDTLSTRKPDPAHLDASFEALSTSAPRIFVGDSEVDAETARRAQVPFLLFANGYRKSAIADIPHTTSYESAADLPLIVTKLLPELIRTI